MKRILVHLQDSTGCSMHRAVLPVRHCADELLERGIQLDLCQDLLSCDRPDAMMVHRILKPEGLVKLAARQHQGMKLMVDCDDLLDKIPKWSNVEYSAKDIECWRALQVVADTRSASTEHLQQAINADKVLPNLVDTSLFDDAHKPAPPPGRAVQILWFGSGTHLGDLQHIEHALFNLCAQLGGRFKLTFWGLSPPSLMQRYLGKCVNYVPQVPIGEFYPRLAGFQPDIVICPLESHPFNKAKSNIKWLEGAMSGAAVVVSDCQAYEEVEDGVTGVVCNGHVEWLDKLSFLIESPTERRLIASQGQECVREDWSWQRSPLRKLWMDAFTELVDEAQPQE